MRVIVTRPQPQADAWVAGLAAAGLDAVALPLIDIAAAADPAPLAAAWHRLDEIDLAVFVSPNAAARFFAARPAGMRWPAQTLAAAPGPGTARLLHELGVPADRLVEPPANAPSFDSESLWPVLAARRDWHAARVLVVRGDGGRDWLAATLRERGAQVAHVAAYRRLAPVFNAAQRGLLDAAQHAAGDHVWLFSSSQAIDNLHVATAGTAAADWTPARAVATHPRIAQRARRLGFGAVFEAAPSLPAVVACLQSIAT